MSAPLVLAVPAKGRLQENAEAFFGRSGLQLVKPRGARDYRGAVAGLDGIEVAYLSASEITTQLAQALDLFESRAGFLAAQGIDLKRVKFSTAFGRGFDYYTGFVFELTDPTRTGDPLVAGGRYDGLLARLGSAEPIAAVGFSVWIERLSVYGGAK